uniref:AlNc14C61G4457 protein n=1 Tax=Albugo laibachii Nc14 TaxID=890382 RepID=F0WCT1_9STRA|nr:AlNc14C61G4457 [Albugo laibachii Nc14]|eukprot:CCA19000.1 AlNc14C61G4457 [Albugo laibachii Nc14]
MSMLFKAVNCASSKVFRQPDGTPFTQTCCLTSALDKKTRLPQPKQVPDESAPMDRVEGVLCSDLKDPITPRARGGIMYLVDIVDDKTNYCSVFLAKTKDQASQNFRQSLFFRNDKTVAYMCFALTVVENIRALIFFGVTLKLPT